MEPTKVTVDLDRKRVIIETDMEPTFERSSTGKSILIASTHGIIKTGAVFQGEQVRIGLNVFIPVR